MARLVPEFLRRAAQGRIALLAQRQARRLERRDGPKRGGTVHQYERRLGFVDEDPSPSRGSGEAAVLPGELGQRFIRKFEATRWVRTQLDEHHVGRGELRFLLGPDLHTKDRCGQPNGRPVETRFPPLAVQPTPVIPVALGRVLTCDVPAFVFLASGLIE